jgi:hypothetical protein
LFLLSKSLSNIYRSLIDRNPTDILKKSNWYPIIFHISCWSQSVLRTTLELSWLSS